MSMKQRVFLVFSFLTFFCLFSTHAKTPQLEYPELMVTPKASERLQLESMHESKNSWLTHWPLQTSAAMTLLAGLMVSRSDVPETRIERRDEAALGGMVVGGSWLVATALLSALYNPYQESYALVSRVNSKTREQQLIKERMAEEGLEAPARLGKRLMYLSVISNAAVSASMLGVGGREATLVSGLAVLAAFAPMFFEYRWNDVYDKHIDYKKRIYGPLTSSGTILFDKSEQKWVPGISLAFYF